MTFLLDALSNLFQQTVVSAFLMALKDVDISINFGNPFANSVHFEVLLAN